MTCNTLTDQVRLIAGGWNLPFVRSYQGVLNSANSATDRSLAKSRNTANSLEAFASRLVSRQAMVLDYTGHSAGERVSPKVGRPSGTEEG